MAIGHTVLKLKFRHVKIKNPKQGEWITFSISYNDIAYKLQNKWENLEAGAIEDVRLYIHGVPSESGGEIDCAWASAWLEKPHSLPVSSDVKHVSNPQLFLPLKSYFTRCNPKIDQHAKAFLEQGCCPMTGDLILDWPVDKPTPNKLSQSGTYRYLWHAMQIVISLLVYADNHGSQAAIFAARDFISDWLERSYFKVDPDSKYTWYDHGTAERLMALLLMYEIGLQQQFDYRFMSRIKYVIIAHGHLLESEVFYAYHQPTRYHNHAWFQDMALIAVSVSMSDLACAHRWLDRAIVRLHDQFDTLITRDNTYAVFVENSIGYHHGIQKLVEFSSELVLLSNQKTKIPALTNELSTWSQFLKYPDGRTPSQGDTFRRSNPLNINDLIERGTPYKKTSAIILPKAGYAIVKGNHDNKPFVLCMFATSLCKTHKHEDNLSITLWFDGIEWLIDPSFYSHDYCNSISVYLRSAKAHNSIWVEDAEYSIEPRNATLSGNSDTKFYHFNGIHTAYKNFEISRSIGGEFNRLYVQGHDSITGTSGLDNLDSRVVFCAGEGVEGYLQKGKIILSHEKSEYLLNVNVKHGGEQSIFRGWNEQKLFSGISGQGFKELAETVTCTVKMQGLQALWDISLSKKNI